MARNWGPYDSGKKQVAKAMMAEMVRVLVDENRLKSVLAEIVGAASVYWAALFLKDPRPNFLFGSDTQNCLLNLISARLLSINAAWQFDSGVNLMQGKKKSNSKTWIIVGSVLGGLPLLAFMLLWVHKYKEMKHLEEMQKAADLEEVLHMTTVGDTKAH